jgi:hypothetical protein
LLLELTIPVDFFLSRRMTQPSDADPALFVGFTLVECGEFVAVVSEPLRVLIQGFDGKSVGFKLKIVHNH